VFTRPILMKPVQDLEALKENAKSAADHYLQEQQV
jgi:hypothetical protein